MKSSEFKNILKPLIKQTVKEVLFEEGVLSGIVSEVARGLQGNLVVEAATPNRKKSQNADIKRREEEYEKQRQERIRRLNESAKVNSNIFEGTREIPEASGHGALSGVSSSDAGVDISAIENLASGKWKHLI